MPAIPSSVFNAFDPAHQGSEALGLWLAMGKRPIEVPAGQAYLVYADGACSGNGAKHARGGWGFTCQGLEAENLVFGYGGEAGSTNNKMELSAVIEALKQLPLGVTVEVRTDSQYVIKGCTEWRKGWERKGMKNSKGEAVANIPLWRALWEHVDARKVKFTWVRGHNGEPGNELADQLAVLGAQH